MAGQAPDWRLNMTDKLGAGTFTVKTGGKLVTIDHWDKIPQTFDHLILFSPDIPPPPHSHEDHELISSIPGKFRELFDRQRGNR
jgi:hypothetical protein